MPAALLTTGVSAPAMAQEVPARVAPEDMRWVAPRLADYTDRVLFGEVWKQRDLTPRDRSLITLSALIAGGHMAQLKGHLGRALDNGVTPAEIGGLITHLAFYTDWPNAVSALGIAREVLDARGVSTAEMQREASSEPAGLRITRKGERPIAIGPADRFTGLVRVYAPIGADGSALSGASVRFEPGARTAWHRHALGQTLIVTEGSGLVQRAGEGAQKICAGDVATIASGEKHWHGAMPGQAMTHVALSQSPSVTWLEQVSDADYARSAD
ncbi:MAG TPA: carboxymuconolactone decarboxylase family protein [Sphingomonas sp.]|nr:carboxymuconolactone decarboxylase family protein [Sphingomonas sp.]